MEILIKTICILLLLIPSGLAFGTAIYLGEHPFAIWMGILGFVLLALPRAIINTDSHEMEG